MEDRPAGAWRFFDPHDASLSTPEDDVARYVLSLLMLHWGRHARCWIWTEFDFARLIGVYHEVSGERLEPAVLSYMFRRNIARRQREAGQSMADMGRLQRLAALAYRLVYLTQAKLWGRSHGV